MTFVEPFAKSKQNLGQNILNIFFKNSIICDLIFLKMLMLNFLPLTVLD